MKSGAVKAPFLENKSGGKRWECCGMNTVKVYSRFFSRGYRRTECCGASAGNHEDCEIPYVTVSSSHARLPFVLKFCAEKLGIDANAGV